MSRRKAFLIVGSVVLVLVGTELIMEAIRGPVACIQIVNQGLEPIEDLTITCGTSKAVVPKIHSSESARVYLSGRGQQVLALKFRQRGNTLTGFELSGFNARMISRDGAKLVIAIRKDEYERYQDDADPSFLDRLGTKARNWLNKSLDPY